MPYNENRNLSTKDCLDVDPENAEQVVEEIIETMEEAAASPGLPLFFLKALEVKNFRSLKEAVFNFQPGLNVIIGANAAKTAVVDALRIILNLGSFEKKAMKNDCRGFSAAKSQQDRDISTFVVSRDERVFFKHPDYEDVRIIFSTVHGVKGETYDGVLFYTKAMTGACSCTPAKKKWVDILQHNLIECENKRIAYVALSRAAQVLHIMAPSASKAAWEALL